MSQPTSLWNHYPQRWDVPLLVIAAAVTLGIGLSLPFLDMRKYFFFNDRYSLPGSIRAMWEARQYFLAVVIFLFSIVFPFAKLAVLLGLWFVKVEHARRRVMLYWLGGLGKWSMLDVFIVALLLVLTKAKALIQAQPQAGLYVFAAAIGLSMFASMRVESLARRVESKPPAGSST